MRKYHKNSWKMVLGIALVIVVFGCVLGLYHHTNHNEEDSNTLNKEDVMENDDIDNNKNDSTNSDVEEESEEKDEQLEKDTQEYSYTTQDGEEVKVEANKSVTATGFSGASNYKFYLRGTTLYFLDSSISDNEEVILAYNVKDLYLENKEVVAELYSDGEVVIENNYITYK